MSIRSACAKGFTTYLAEQHKSSLQESIGKGVAIGGLMTGGLWGADQAFDLDYPWWAFLSTFVIVSSFSLGNHLVSVNNADLEHKAAFDAVCGKYDEEDGE